VRALIYSILATILYLAALSCDEALLPRVHPLSIDPEEFLELTFSAPSGLITFYEGIPTVGGAGIFELSVRNLHDEVLQGQADIQIDIDYWSFRDGNTFRHAHGDSNNLRNYYNFNGGHFLLNEGLLTIEPDSIARFVVAIDHLREQIWTLLDPQIHPGDPVLTTGEIDFTAKGTISLFKNYPPLNTDEINFWISYSFIELPQPNLIHEMRVYLDSLGLVHVDWKAYGNPPTLVEFRVQKSLVNLNTDYETIAGGILPATGGHWDTTSYSFSDQSTITGAWFYRVAQVEKVGPDGLVIGITGYSDIDSILVP